MIDDVFAEAARQGVQLNWDCARVKTNVAEALLVNLYSDQEERAIQTFREDPGIAAVGVSRIVTYRWGGNIRTETIPEESWTSWQAMLQADVYLVSIETTVSLSYHEVHFPMSEIDSCSPFSDRAQIAQKILGWGSVDLDAVFSDPQITVVTSLHEDPNNPIQIQHYIDVEGEEGYLASGNILVTLKTDVDVSLEN